MQTPWSANPFYTDGQIQAFNRAGESAIMVGPVLRATSLGLPGVGASVFYFNGWTQAPAAGAPVLEYEWDFNLEWRPNWNAAARTSGSARATAWRNIDQNNVRTTIDEVRLILNYTVKLY